MKLKIILLMCVLILSPIFTSAALVDKPLNITIENCYNVSITAELEEGTETDIQFVGCKKTSSEQFSCECLNENNNNFSIIMRTDNTIVRDIRYYDLYISARYFHVYRKTLSVNVEDGGEYYKQYQKEWRETTNKAKKFIKIEYINNTIYEDRIVEVIKEKIIYEDIIINNTITEYIENKTKIEKLEKKVKTKNNMLKIIITIFSLSTITIITLYYKKQKE